MSQLDALLDRSRSPGTFIEKKAFTLAKSKAIEKMREFALRHPRQYVLELVQAAVFAGARWIAIDVQADAIVVAWVGGTVLTGSDLERLFDYLFADQGEASTRHLMQTAVGVNAILQRRPRRLRIESGDGTLKRTHRMDLDKKGEGQIGTPQTPLAGTYIYAEFATNWLARFTGTQAFPPEVELVETRCVYTPTPILLNGHATFGYKSSRDIRLFGVKSSVAFDEGTRRGALGIPIDSVRSGVRLVTGGVWVCDNPMTELGEPIIGVISDDSLRKTADMSDIVQDGHFVDLLHHAQPFASDLLRRIHGPSYSPPALRPRILATTPGAEPAQVPPSPLPARLLQLAPRGHISQSTVTKMGPDDLLFWTEESAAEALQPAADPSIFPFRVLLLTPGQALTLERTLPEGGPSLSRITHPEDVSFIRSAIERRTKIESTEVAIDLSTGTAASPATLTLQLHLEGPTPRWDPPHPVGNGVPALQRLKGQTLSCHGLDLTFPHVSVIVGLRHRTQQLSEELFFSRISQAVQGEIWRLTQADGPVTAPRRRELQLAVLAAYVRPQLSWDAQAGAQVHAAFPLSWTGGLESLTELPLATTAQGPLTLARFAALHGTDDVVWLEGAHHRESLTFLEQRFGFGHLVVPEDSAAPLAIVGRTGDAWRQRTAQDLGEDHVEELIIVYLSLHSPPAPDGWVIQSAPGPGIAHFRRADVRPIARGLGIAALLDALEPMAQGDDARAAAMAQLAQLRLSVQVDRLGELRLAGIDGSRVSCTKWLTDPATRVVARGGAIERSAGTLPLTLDEYMVLNSAAPNPDAHLPLLMDDPPEVWGHHAQDSEWLVRHNVHHPGISGWIGLRAPWDPSSTVLIESSRGIAVESALLRSAPCHGSLNVRGSRALSQAQRELVQVGAVQLYLALMEPLQSDADPAARQVAERYAATFVALQTSPDAPLLAGAAHSLAQHVRVYDDAGAPWGSLLEWLACEPNERPPPPMGWVTPQSRRTEGAVHNLAEVERTLGFIEGPVERALGAAGVLATVQIQVGADTSSFSLSSSEGKTTLYCRLPKTALVERCLGADTTARGLVLLDVGRRACESLRQTGRPVDSLVVQRSLIASHVASST